MFFITTKTHLGRAVLRARPFPLTFNALMALLYPFLPYTCRYLSIVLVTRAADGTTTSRHAARRLISGLDLRW